MTEKSIENSTVQTSPKLEPAIIQTLSSEVVDQIAAGEVVERPAHLIKELVENSLDAGATEVTIEFSEGGRFAKVSDNGTGIRPEDLAKALDRHATSKINKSSDLFRLTSFGFRGEALASIAAVSKLTLTSKTSKMEQASRLFSQFGQRSEVEKVGGSQGTTIVIEDLFTNVPARLKFLKSAAAEGGRIKTTLKAMALSHPNVTFKVLQEGNIVHLWPACETRLERARQILEVENLYEGFAERGDSNTNSVRAYAVFADPKTVQKTARDIWFFAQNRWIQDKSLQAAVMEAYRHLLMHGEYPIAAIWVETNPENIDVNIHPTKSQVKFVDASLAFRAVQASLRDSLEKAPWLSNNLGNNLGNQNLGSPVPAANDFGYFSEPQAPAQNFSFDSAELQKTQYPQKNWSMMESMRTYQAPPQPIANRGVESSAVITESSVPSRYWSSLQVLGQANLTYILTQNSQGMVIVDQHAAHERVMFEKLMKAWRGGKIEVQEFLFPLAVDLSAEKVEALLTEKAQIEKLGIEIEALGPETLGVKAAPLIIKESALTSVLEKMAHEIVENGGSHSLERKIGDLIATMACHSAIRAGQALSPEEMKSLLESMDEFPLSCFCPHGRPVNVEYPFYQLEKDFGRIV